MVQTLTSSNGREDIQAGYLLHPLEQQIASEHPDHLKCFQ
jgi:hypothetical protein